MTITELEQLAGIVRDLRRKDADSDVAVLELESFVVTNLKTGDFGIGFDKGLIRGVKQIMEG